MKVLIDSRMLYASGIGRFIRDWVSILVDNDTCDISMTGSLLQLRKFVSDGGERFHRINLIQYDAPIYSVQEQIQGSSFFKKLATQHDVVHFPHYNVPFLVPNNSVVTVHDLIQFSDATQSRIKRAFGWFVLKRAMTAKMVHTVSQTTAEELKQHFPGIGKKFVVSSPVVDVSKFKKTQSVTPHNEIPEGKYILYVGNRKPHKNIITLLRAFSRIQEMYPELCLVIVGQQFRSDDDVSNALRANWIRNLRTYSDVSDEFLRDLYSHASALVMPSLKEGFGYPPLEALACGTPVIASDIPIFRETLGDNALYFSPLSDEQLAGLLAGVATRPSASNCSLLPRSLLKSSTEAYAEMIGVYRRCLS